MAHMVGAHSVIEEKQCSSRSVHPTGNVERTCSRLGFSDGNVWGPGSDREHGELFSDPALVAAPNMRKSPGPGSDQHKSGCQTSIGKQLEIGHGRDCYPPSDWPPSEGGNSAV